MTEEIIIDDINVAGCYWKCKDGDCAMYYADLSADNNELEFGFNCEDNPDCYYKQLIRLEQENKELKEQIKKYSSINEQDTKDYAILRNALEEIKEIVNEPCIEDEDCETCDSNCMCKEILDKINEVLNS